MIVFIIFVGIPRLCYNNIVSFDVKLLRKRETDMLLDNTITYCWEILSTDPGGPVDVHTHGCMGIDFTTAEPEKIAEACRYYAEKGIAGIFPTVMTAPADVMIKACRNIAGAAEIVSEWNAGKTAEPVSEYKKEKSAGFYSKILGINLEGPFLSPVKCGAQPVDCIRQVSDAFLEECQEASGGMVRLMTIAPEMPGALEFISRNHGEGLLFSVGHTDCDYETAKEAFEAGAGQLTHAFNAMRGLHHREPGPVTAAVESGAWIEMICDGIHIHPSVVKMMEQLCPDKLLPISDSIWPCGLEDGRHGSFEKRGREIRLVNGGGLAGGGTFLTEGI